MWFDIQLIYSINESRSLGSLELGFRCSLEYNNQCFGLVPQNASSLLITSQETVGFFSPFPSLLQTTFLSCQHELLA